MTRKDVVSLLSEQLYCRKSALSTIKAIIEAGKKCGYDIVKKGIDEFEVCEIGIVRDFTKPLRFHRQIPALASTQSYNNVPIMRLFSDVWAGGYVPIEAWCFIANKKDGDILHFDELNCIGETIEEKVKDLDALTALGYLEETENYLEFYLYPQSRKKINYMENSISIVSTRFAPYKYLN